MTKRNLALVLLYVFCTSISAAAWSASQAAPSNPDSLAWFKKTTAALHNAFMTGDSSIWSRVLNDRFMMTSEEGIVLNKQEMVKQVTPLPPGFSGRQKIRDLTVQELGNCAVVHFLIDEWEDVLGDHLFTTYIETDTYIRKGARWSMIAAQVTVAPRNLPPVKIDTSGWRDLTGVFGINGDSRWTYQIYEQDGKLFSRHSNNAVELIPLSPLVYYEKGTIHILVFVRGAHGAVDRLLELHKYNEVNFKRLASSKGSNR